MRAGGAWENEDVYPIAAWAFKAGPRTSGASRASTASSALLDRDHRHCDYLIILGPSPSEAACAITSFAMRNLRAAGISEPQECEPANPETQQ